LGDKIKFHVEWADVREIVAYKEDLLTVDRICIGFRTDATDRYKSVTEEDDHYEVLLTELPRQFDGIRTGWFRDVAFPPFFTNRTLLWGEPLEQTS
jgi:hypothetical protein